MDSLTIWRHGAVLAALCGPCALSGAASPPAVESVAARAAAASAPVARGPATSAPSNAPGRTAAGAVDTVDDAELDGARGGAGASATLVDTRLAGQVSGNTANNVQTGWNVIDGGAFSNVTGIPIVVQNSGANVLIQNATVIHLQLQ